MLYTDRDCLTIQDVVAIDPDVLEVATAENIPTEGDNSFIHQAVEECGSQLIAEFQNFSYNFDPHNFAIQAGFYGALGYDATPFPRIKLGMVVVDSADNLYASPLKRYVTFLALRNFYNVASNRKLDDKYQAKMNQLDKDIKNKYLRNFRASGLPVVNYPIPCPGAKYELNQGIWDDSNVTAVSGGSTTGDTYDVAITWVTNVGESGPSETITLTVPDNSVIAVDISSLNQPQGTMAWKLFAGKTGNTMFLQEITSNGISSVTLPSSPVLRGEIIGRGQPRDANLTFINLFNRA